MVRRISTFIIALFFIGIFLSSCAKSDVIGNENDITGTWAVTGIRSDIAYDWNGDGYTETDIFNNYSYCQRDILLSFDYNGNGQSRQGCNASWLAMYWQLSNNNRTLNINLPDDDINLNISRFDSNTIIGDDRIYVDGRYYNITYTLQRR
jgi:hypothetical protein